jgi:hypothetical protein
MASNSSSEYKVVTDKIVSPDEDIIIAVAGDMYKGSITPNNKYVTASEAGGEAAIADFVFDTVEDPDYESTMTVTNNDMVIKTVVDTEASGNIRVESAQNIVLNADGDAYIGDSGSQDNRIATIGDISSAGTGDFEFNDNVMSTEDVTMNIQAKRDSSTLGSTIEFNPNDGRVGLYGYTSPRTDTYTSGSDWAGDATWSSHGEGGSQIVLTDATELITFLNGTFNQAPVQLVSINGSAFYDFDGASGDSDNITIYTFPGAPSEPTVVTSLEFRYQTRSRIEIDDDDEEILIQGIGLNVNLRSTGTISFRSNLNDDNEYSWQMGSDGKLQLPGDGYIENVVNGSGDGNGGDTLKLVPDSTLGTDQYLIIDPTAGPTGPDHIHIRAGGTQDASTADLFLGAEETNVKVSDTSGAVRISTSYKNNVIELSNEGVTTSSEFLTTTNPELHYVIGEGWTVKNANGNVTVEIIGATSPEPDEVVFTVAEANFFVPDDSYQFFPPTGNPDGDIQWEFAPNGAIYGPAMGGVKVPAITNVQAGEELFVYANRAQLNVSADKDVSVYSDEGDIILNSDVGGEYLGSNSEENQIATLGDIGVDTTFTVAGGALGTQPTFTGDPLFTGSYVKTGPMIHFRIDVDMDNITSFGTGQYYLDLPFPAKYNYLFRNACLHDVSMPRQYGLSGHVEAGQSRMLLFYTDTSGQDYAFDYNSPALLTVNDNFHVSGDYIWEPEAP